MYKEIIWFELAAFALSLVALPKIWKSSYLRIYPFLLLIVVVVEGYFNFIPQKRFRNADVYNIQVPLQYLCYLAILYFAAAGRGFKIFLVGSMAAVIFFAIITNIYFTPKGYSNVLSYSFCSIITIVGIVWKFYEILKNPLEFNFLRNPFFYMLFAFLIFNLGTLPFFSMSNWLYNTQEYRDIYFLLIKAMSVLNYILYTTYSIAFIWILQKKVSY
jgi:hypothetical protein